MAYFQDRKVTPQNVSSADVVICGAGIAGISAAYYLAVKHGLKNVVLVDERPPLTLTSDKSTECYRNWWPGPGDAMVRYMNRSIDLLEDLAHQSNNVFQMNRRGYVFLTADPQQAEQYRQSAAAISALGAGPVRYHQAGASTYRPAPAHGFEGQPSGADLLFGADLIRQHYPFVTEDVVAMLHTRRCGWFSANELGLYMLQEAKAHGVQLVNGRVTAVGVANGRVENVCIASDGRETRLATHCFVNAAGPHLKRVGQMVAVDLPVFNELHGKIALWDTHRIVPNHVPLMIWSDPVKLPWSDEEQRELAEDEEARWLLDDFPAGVHFRPEGAGDSPVLIILWTYDVEVQEPVWPPRFDPTYPEIVLRGLTRMIPGLSVYLEKMGKPVVDGGYYCKTKENRPLVGPLPVAGSFVIGALSGFGLMASQAAGDLLAAHVTGSSLPDYAPAFLLNRYEDPVYQAELAQWDALSGQL
jgi:sarcosine oxidase, subunit beta